jgi:hypothetical protein
VRSSQAEDPIPVPDQFFHHLEDANLGLDHGALGGLRDIRPRRRRRRPGRRAGPSPRRLLRARRRRRSIPRCRPRQAA